MLRSLYLLYNEQNWKSSITLPVDSLWFPYGPEKDG